MQSKSLRKIEVVYVTFIIYISAIVHRNNFCLLISYVYEYL